jgi:dTMP kinase
VHDPWFIALEGGEGCGKSTQAARLAQRLDAVLTREPGGTGLGLQLRALLLTPGPALDQRAELLAMNADRAQHLAEVVRPALAAGRDVVTDRSAWSSMAYQGYGRGLPLGEVRALCDWASAGRWPDLVVLLDVPDDVAAARLQGAPDRFEAEGDGFHARVRAGFRAMAAEHPDTWVVVDGARSIDDVAAAVAAAVDERRAAPGGAPS